MNNKHFAAMAVLGAIVLGNSLSYADSCSRWPNPYLYDDFYAPRWGCQQVYINDMWSRFSFDKDDWDQGFGYEDCCNDSLPLKRTFNALQVLGYAATGTPTCSTSSSNVCLWAYCWAGNSIDELNGRCGESSRAYTKFGIIIDNYTDLYMPFFYDETVVQRAGTIFHEARHAQGWCSHTSDCSDGNSSCDPNWGSGCVGFGSGSGVGANAYTVLFMNWFATTATSAWINSTIRQNAVDEGNYYLSHRFGTDPCFRLNSAGYSYQTC
jgi:hypothetical protein